MKSYRWLVASSLATLAAVGVVSAAGLTFSTDLKVGSTGTDVVNLQTMLLQNGFHIPALESGLNQKGTFGGQTRKAVQQYQTAHKISATGYVGPLTRASLNSLATGMPANTAAMTAAAVNATPNTAPNSAPSNPLQTSIMTPGAVGTLAVSLWPAPADGTPVYKGQAYDIVAYKVQAAASDELINSISLDFDVRLWLYANAITIKDDAGNILGTVSNLTSSNFSELTVGSDYRVNVPTNYVIPANRIKYFTVNVKFLSLSDRTNGTLHVTRSQFRAVDGSGTTDTQTVNSSRSFSYQGIGGVVYFTTDAQSPPNMLVPISTGGPTLNVPIGVVDVQSQAIDSTMRSMQIYVNTSADNIRNVSTIISAIKLQSGDHVYVANDIQYSTDGSLVTFNNMDLPLPANQQVPLALLFDIQADTNHGLDGIAASSTLVAAGTAGGVGNNPEIEDANFNSVDINDAPLLTSDITFSASDAHVDYTATSTGMLGTPVSTNNTTSIYPITEKFTLVAGDNTLYVSTNANTALSTTSTGLSSNYNAQIRTVTTNPGQLSGDTNSYYVIPAGSSRMFNYTGTISNTGGTAGLKTFQITGINYGTTTSNLNSNAVVYYNYQAFKISATF